MRKTTGVLSSIAIGIMIGIIIFECILAIKIYNSRGSGSINIEIKDGEESVVEFDKAILYSTLCPGTNPSFSNSTTDSSPSLISILMLPLPLEL